MSVRSFLPQVHPFVLVAVPVLLLQGFVFAPSAFSWIAQEKDGRYSRTSRDVVVDSTGHVFISGRGSRGGEFVRKRSPDTGAILWEYSPPLADESTGAQFVRMTLLPDESVVAVGTRYSSSNPTEEALIVRLSPADGVPIWSSSAGLLRAVDVATDSSGNVIVVGDDTVGGRAAKLSGATGTVLWEVSAGANRVLVDSDDDIITAAGGDTVEKIDGQTGAGIWSRAIAVAWLATDDPLALDAVGDVLVSAGASIHKLSGSDGTPLWATSDSAAGGAVAIAPTGEMFAATTSGGESYNVRRLDPTSGNVLWTVNELAFRFPAFLILTVDPTGNPVLAGRLGDDFGISVYHAGSGAVIFDRRFDGISEADSGYDRDRALAFAVDSSGRFVAVGALDQTRGKTRRSASLSVRLKPDGGFGTQGVRGDNLRITNHADPLRSRILVKNSGPSPFIDEQQGTVNDPRCTAPGGGGGTLTLVGLGGSGQAISIDLPCENWRGVGKPNPSFTPTLYHNFKGWRYDDRDRAFGPCFSVRTKGLVTKRKKGKVLVKCDGRNPIHPIPYVLSTGGESAVASTLTIGATTVCAEYPGSEGFVAEDSSSVFSAKKNLEVPSECVFP